MVSLQTVSPRALAAVRRHVAPGTIASAWRPALDLVWQFVRTQPGLHAGGHNVLVYHAGAGPRAPLQVDFGVEVTRAFEHGQEVHATETPAGLVAAAVHVGPYHRLAEAHGAIQAWCQDQQRPLVGQSWEVYGDWTEDETKLETSVFYLLA